MEATIYNEQVPYEVFLKGDGVLAARFNHFIGYLCNFNGHHYYFRLANGGMAVVVPYDEVDIMFPRQREYKRYVRKLNQSALDKSINS